MLYHPINKLLNTVEYLIVLSLSSSGYLKLILIYTSNPLSESL